MAWYVARSLNVLRDEINKSAPKRSKKSDGALGDAQHKLRQSDHNPCVGHEAVCARDITHDPKGGFDSYAFADWLRQRCQSGVEKRVKYIISNRRIASSPGWQWRKYSGGNPHDHHVHVSVTHGPEAFDSTASWGWGQPTKPTTPTTPTTPPPKGFLMALTDQQQKDLYDRIMGSTPGPYSDSQRGPGGSGDGLRRFGLDDQDGAYIAGLLERIAAKVGA